MPRGKRPAMSPEAQENRMINLAIDLAEKQLAEGTASQSIILHYLKLADTRERLEQEKLAHEIELLRAKRESIESSQRVEELYENAVAAMREYSGAKDEEL